MVGSVELPCLATPRLQSWATFRDPCMVATHSERLCCGGVRSPAKSSPVEAQVKLSVRRRDGAVMFRKDPKDHSEATRSKAVQNRCSKQPDVPSRDDHTTMPFGTSSTGIAPTTVGIQQNRCDLVPDLARTAAVFS